MNAFLPFLQSFQASLKAFQLYGPAHPRTVEGLDAAEGATGALFEGDKGCRIAVTASCSVVFREIGFEPSRLNDVTAWTCSSA